MPTSVTPEILAHCSDKVRRLYDYWDRKPAGRLMPSRTDIDPLELGHYLANITLVDVVADKRRYVDRLVRTREVDARGENPTGHSVLTKFFCNSRKAAVDNYDRVCRERVPLFGGKRFIAPSGRRGGNPWVFLPLASDDEAVSEILICCNHDGPQRSRRIGLCPCHVVAQAIRPIRMASCRQ